jgi:hypothetical protein
VLSDGDGLELQIHPGGTKTWYLRCRVHPDGPGAGLQRRVPLGAYPAVSLSGGGPGPTDPARKGAGIDRNEGAIRSRNEGARSSRNQGAGDVGIRTHGPGSSTSSIWSTGWRPRRVPATAASSPTSSPASTCPATTGTAPLATRGTDPRGVDVVHVAAGPNAGAAFCRRPLRRFSRRR